MDSVFLRERALHLVPFLLQFVCFGNWLRVLAAGCTNRDPRQMFYCRLGSTLVRYLPLSARLWHIHSHMSLCFDVGWQFVLRLVTVSEVVWAQRHLQGGSHPPQRLNIPQQTLQICLSCYVFSASHEREMSKTKMPAIASRGRGGLGWLFHLCAGPTGVFVKVFSLVREELR